MKKDIYIIKNTINDKVYIGQAKNSAERWLRHLSAANRGLNYVISKAMRKYGAKNFYYQVLEEQIENYDEREIYWINYYNSRVPNGYNVACGGSSVGCGIEHPCATFNSTEDILVIIDLLKNTNRSMDTIANDIGCSMSVISQINLGATYKQPNIDYPIRKTHYEQELIKQIHYSLQFELDKSINRIASEYKIDRTQVCAINKGELHSLPGKTYPLRSGRAFSVNAQFVDEIIYDIQNTDLMLKDIARKYNVSKSFVSAVNKGVYYHKDNIEYPIRDNYQASPITQVCFSPDELAEIENELRTTKSIREIAKEHESCYSTILNINNGTITKYHKNDIKYPIRTIIK